MPKGIFHAVVLTNDLEGTIRFLHDVSGITPIRRYAPDPAALTVTLGWPSEQCVTEAAVIGEGPGMLEVILIPPALRPDVSPGVSMLSVATPNLEHRTDLAREAGFEPQPAFTANGADGAAITVSQVQVGGVGYELVRFGDFTAKNP
jgi:hypothetical protein